MNEVVMYGYVGGRRDADARLVPSVSSKKVGFSVNRAPHRGVLLPGITLEFGSDANGPKEVVVMSPGDPCGNAEIPPSTTPSTRRSATRGAHSPF